jgi:hypothetical protein
LLTLACVMIFLASSLRASWYSLPGELVFKFVEIGTFGFFFLYARDMLTPFLKIFALAHLPLVRGFYGRLEHVLP